MRATTPMNRLWLLAACAALCAATSGLGCATAGLTQQGARVEMTDTVDKQTCINLGPVVGKGGGFLGGSFIADEDLVEYALNDLRNKAAAKRATHVTFAGHEMGMTTGKDGGSTSTATIVGIAYRCWPGVAAPEQPAAVAAAPAPAAAPAAVAPAPAAPTTTQPR